MRSGSSLGSPRAPAFLLLAVAATCAGDCHSAKPRVEPAIEFTKLPPAGEGGPDALSEIAGRVKNAESGQRVVLYARSGLWWVQPLADRAFTQIGPDSTWKNSTHIGTAYAALLVHRGYDPPLTAKVLPGKGGEVLAVASAEGAMLVQPPADTLRFSGYEWEIRKNTNNPGGTRNLYDPSNARVDDHGFLHLRIAKQKDGWTSAQVTLHQSLGYGSYSFTARDVSHLEPSSVLNLSIWDNGAPSRETDIEISRWGELASKNAQYVVQPYYVAENSVRFLAPAGVLTHTIRWKPDRVSFQTVRTPPPGAAAEPVAGHVFTSGIPAPGNDSVQMNLYVFANQRNPLRHDTEVVIEKFEFLP